MRIFPRALSSNSGMTLLELLVAMAIFSIIATASYSALEQGVSIQYRLKQKREFWRQFESAIQLIENDLSQAVNREPRIPGAGRMMAFRGAHNNRAQVKGELVRFTNAGHSSFRSNPASPYKRIAYHLRDNTLYRTVWSHPDRPFGLAGVENEVLNDIEELRIRYLIAKRWVNNWNLDPYNPSSDNLPKALEVQLHLKNKHIYTRVFHVGHASS